MNSTLPHARMSALAYLYDHLDDLPVWLRKLTPGQLKDVADVMIKWQLPNQSHSILPMEEIERREVLRAVALSSANVIKAAEALKIGRTTIYRKLRQWGYTIQNRALLAQAAALADKAGSRGEHFW